MKTGLVLSYNKNIIKEFNWCMENDIPTCQLSVAPELQTKNDRDIILNAVKESGIEITAIVGTWSGPNEWNFYYGPLTLGIVPNSYRHNRMNQLEHCGLFSKSLGVNSICTHMGFIPENPNDENYQSFIGATRHLANEYEKHEITLNFETGQETPVTLLRSINDIGKNNIGINFDPANLLMYGKANPIDALDIVGKYVNGVHGKDGEYPTDGINLGVEKPLGEGRVNIPKFIEKLKEISYTGAITIEREISGERQKQDVIKANKLLKALI